ncbi:hypothetical protein DRE_01032 [Drechslerella stenobrocha 248]|uniref:RING-type domain-containing protein n=1 Tax=Drechslerella stenobrocha 248 TaxID=1043628 RepID=W7HYG3_9PEZI|nr:hypothetical protein DRE_01032 [Drechslerella stenobrocha 248]
MPPSRSSRSSLQSVDLRALDYLTTPSANLLCPICHSPLITPVQTRCLHTFCSACLSLSLDRSLTCPIDRQPLSHDEVTPAPIMIANLVNDLPVLCPNHELGCGESCARWLVESHVREDCGYAVVKCVKEGCSGVVERREADAGCLHGEIECEYCNDAVRLADLESHLRECPKVSSECPHCLQSLPNSELVDHIPECPEAIVDCQASCYGCSHTSPRLEIGAHETNCHFVALTPVLQFHAERISTLELENKAIRQKLDLLVPPRPLATPAAAASTTAQPNQVNAASSSSSIVTTTGRDMTSEMQDYTFHLYSEYEQLRSDVERLNAQIRELDVKQDMARINEGLRYNDEMTGMRAAIDGLRMQLHWLLANRREVGSTGSPAAAGTTGRSVAGTASAGDARRMSVDSARQVVKL